MAIRFCTDLMPFCIYLLLSGGYRVHERGGMQGGVVVSELTDVLALLRKMVSHCASVTGNRRLGTSIVHAAVKRHSRERVLTDPESLDAILKDITETARRSPVLHPDESNSDFGASYGKLPFDARACLSLRNLFGFDFQRIGEILDMEAQEVEALHGSSMATLADELTKARTSPFLH